MAKYNNNGKMANFTSYKQGKISKKKKRTLRKIKNGISLIKWQSQNE